VLEENQSRNRKIALTWRNLTIAALFLMTANSNEKATRRQEIGSLYERFPADLARSYGNSLYAEAWLLAQYGGD